MLRLILVLVLVLVLVTSTRCMALSPHPCIRLVHLPLFRLLYHRLFHSLFTASEGLIAQHVQRLPSKVRKANYGCPRPHDLKTKHGPWESKFSPLCDSSETRFTPGPHRSWKPVRHHRDSLVLLHCRACNEINKTIHESRRPCEQDPSHVELRAGGRTHEL